MFEDWGNDSWYDAFIGWGVGIALGGLILCASETTYVVVEVLFLVGGLVVLAIGVVGWAIEREWGG